MINWINIKKDVETTGCSYRSLAEKHGVNHSTISKKAKNEEWNISHRNKRKSTKSTNKNNSSVPEKSNNDNKEFISILGNIALRKIEELKKELGKHYSPIDEPLIVMCAKSYEEYINLALKVSDEGYTCISSKTGATYLNPTFNAYQAVQKNLITIANQLGLSISSRKRLGISFKKEEDQNSIFDFAKELTNYDDEDLEDI